MEISQPTAESPIPLSIKTKYDEEQSRFKRYDLNNPQKFIALLRKQLKKEEDPIGYLKKLRMLASKLLLQHLLTQKNANMSYIASYKQILIEGIENTFSEMGAKKINPRKYQIIPENDAQLAEILAHSKLLQELVPYTPQERQVLYSWIIDPSKGKVINSLGLNRKYTHEGIIAKQQIKEYEEEFDYFAIPISSNDFHKLETPKIIEDNSSYFSRIFENLETYFTKVKKYKILKPGEYEPKNIRKDYEDENKSISDLYTATHEWYEQLYKIVYQELQNTYRELVKQFPKDASLVENLKSLPHQSVEAKKIPLFLPKELAPFIEPSKTITLASLDDELEQARTAWKAKLQKSAATTEKKAEIKELLREEKPEGTTQPKKIKESPTDGSYILEGEETETQLTIHNPKNKTVEIIFKTDKSAQNKNIPPINYTDWIKMWFANPEQALKIQGYTTFGGPKYEYPENRWKAVTGHAFAILIDDYVQQWSTQSLVDSRRVKGKKDILITIPGMIKYPNGKSETGVFTYLIDSGNGQWYHRMFTPHTGRQLIEDLALKGYFSPQMTGYYDVFFPPLSGKS